MVFYTRKEGERLFCQIVVDLAVEQVSQPFTYGIPDDMRLQRGQRVAVPFGYRVVEGIVLNLSETTEVPLSKIKQVIRPLEEYPAIMPELIDLAVWMAGKAHCPLAETLRLMMPAEMRGERIHAKQQKLVTLIRTDMPVEQLIAAEKRSAKRAAILRILADGLPHLEDELKQRVRDPREALLCLAEKGLIRIENQEVLRRPGNSIRDYSSLDPELTDLQEEVLEIVTPEMEQGRGTFLLHGVTGSGKTEVFIRLVRRALELGRGAIILVPEIALTPQMVSWFRTRFGEAAAVIHSRLSAGERYDEWRRIRRGEARVVIGARSAVFSPVRDLGLIVVDEEHETTYQNDRNPRYDAREVAERRCGTEGGTLLLASATPSILSFAKARRGDYVLLEMPERVHNRPMPAVELADMRKELENGNRSVFSGRLERELRTCVQSGHQAMLLMNRRGYNSFVNCRSCGQVIKCPNCDIAMTYHLNGGDRRLHCHYCGAVKEPPAKCPECGSGYIRYFGAGTEKIEEELQRLLPGVPIARMDVDTTGGKDGHARILDEFRSGRTRVLVGTQMIAKGLDFPGVTLVGVIAADMTLNLPDYRSRERTFQLLTQVAGRAGRGDDPGKVIIQTYKPEDPVIVSAARQNYRSFFEEEFQRRRRGLYPPFTAMARLLVEAKEEKAAGEHAKSLMDRIVILLEENPLWKRRILLLRLDQPSVKVLRGKTRWQILMKLLIHEDTERFCSCMTEMTRESPPGVETWFEYNPTTMI